MMRLFSACYPSQVVCLNWWRFLRGGDLSSSRRFCDTPSFVGSLISLVQLMLLVNFVSINFHVTLCRAASPRQCVLVCILSALRFYCRLQAHTMRVMAQGHQLRLKVTSLVLSPYLSVYQPQYSLKVSLLFGSSCVVPWLLQQPLSQQFQGCCTHRYYCIEYTLSLEASTLLFLPHQQRSLGCLALLALATSGMCLHTFIRVQYTIRSAIYSLFRCLSSLVSPKHFLFRFVTQR